MRFAAVDERGCASRVGNGWLMYRPVRWSTRQLPGWIRHDGVPVGQAVVVYCSYICIECYVYKEDWTRGVRCDDLPIGCVLLL